MPPSGIMFYNNRGSGTEQMGDVIMANIYTSADQLIGKTPLLELTH